MSVNQFEILAPAGNKATLDAALAAGANAVYFGIKDFNARLRADNFTIEDLPAIMDRLHHYGRRGYLTLNTLLFNSELTAVADILPKIIAAGVDALIITDLGLIDYIHKNYPQIPLHASTQLTTTSAAGCQYLAAHGISRVVLARELSLGEIAKISQNTTLEIEAFAHGAYCISYSGQCQVSEALLGRSANRGLCAQLCRQKYILDGQKNGAYWLSPHDLQAIDLLPKMMAAGVTSFKIEGRLKSPAYVYTVTAAYRAALDAALAGKKLPQEELAKLGQVFNRQPGSGYLTGCDHSTLVNLRASSFQGQIIGELLGMDSHNLFVAPTGPACQLNNGDGIAVGQKGGAVTLDQFAQGGRLFKSTTGHYKGQKALQLTIGPAQLDTGKFRPGLAVFKNQDNDLQTAMERACKREPDYLPAWPLELTIEPSTTVIRFSWKLTVWQGKTYNWSQEAPMVSGSTPCQLVRKQFSRLGGTPFFLCGIKFPMEFVENLPWALTPGQLNQLRRAASEHFLSFLEDRYPVNKAVIPEFSSPPAGPGRHLSLLCRTMEQLAAACQLSHKWERIWLDLPADKLTDAIALVTENSLPWGLCLPAVELPEEDITPQLLAYNPPALLVRTLGQLSVLKDYKGLLVGDSGLNCANYLAAGTLYQQGLTRITPAWEVFDKTEPANEATIGIERLIYTHRPLYLTRYCLLAAKNHRHSCQDCPGYCQQDTAISLKSDDNRTMLLNCRYYHSYTILFNNEPELRPVSNRAVGYFRIELLAESGLELSSKLRDCIDIFQM